MSTSQNTTRRCFLLGLAGLFAAPAVMCAESLTKLVTPAKAVSLIPPRVRGMTQCLVMYDDFGFTTEAQLDGRVEAFAQELIDTPRSVVGTPDWDGDILTSYGDVGPLVTSRHRLTGAHRRDVKTYFYYHGKITPIST